MKNAYLVLSVADIRNMLRAAELEQKVRGETRESITIVLENLTISACGQITSWSVNAAVEKHAKDSAEDLDNRPKMPMEGVQIKDDASWLALTAERDL